MTRVASVVLILLALLPVTGRAQALADLVGTWYSETRGAGTVNGQAYDMRRELIRNHSDSTKTNTNRYYLGDTMVAEIVATYGWRVENGVYATECRTVLSGGQASLCSTRYEYDLISVTQQEVRYKSRSSGTTYSNIRVGDDFKLP